MASSKFLVAMVVLYLGTAAGFTYTIWHLHNKVEALESSQAAAGAIEPQTFNIPNVDAHWNRLWNGFGPVPGDFSLLSRDFDRLIEGLASPSAELSRFSTAAPKISVEEDAEEYRVTVESPKGVDIEIQTELNERYLTLSGSLEGATSHDHHQTRFSNAFTRSILLGEPVEQAEMEVISEEGKVTVRVPKRLG